VRAILLIAMLCLSSELWAQVEFQTKIPLSFYANKSKIASNTSMHVYLKGEESSLRKVVNDLGGTFKYMSGKYAAVILPFESLPQLDHIEAVKAIHFEIGSGQSFLNKSTIHTRMADIHNGVANLPEEYKGQGVIIGMIDAGIDLMHPDFQDANGDTRILEIWDQTLEFDAQYTPVYGYGQVYDSTDINNNICPTIDNPAFYGHGTNTTGITAGKGSSSVNAELAGYATESSILIVVSNFQDTTWTATVADAVHYLFSRAEAYGMPCVINASLGNYSGSHDGRDIPTQIMNDLITDTTGRIMVCAAGNSGETPPYHLGYESSSDTNFTWFQTASNATYGNGQVYFEIFGDLNDFESIHFSVGADKITPNFEYRGHIPFATVVDRLYVVHTDTLLSSSGNYLGIVQSAADSLNGTYRLAFFVSLIDSINFNYSLLATGSGRLDLWCTANPQISGLNDMVSSGLPTTAQFPAISRYKSPDAKQYTAGNWACSEKIITVGNFTNRTSYVNVNGNNTVFPTLTEGGIALSSSGGPSRTGTVKPDIAAPGEVVLAAGAAYQIANQIAFGQSDRVAADGMHHRASGTSMASPAAAGIAAAFLEYCPNANWEDFKTALIAGAKSDGFPGSAPNDRWGYGKADAVNTLKYFQPKSSLVSDGNALCEGKSLDISLGENFPSVLWTSGQTASTISVNQGGVYFATLTNELGCVGYSDTLVVFERPNPAKPIIGIEGDLPACENDPVTLRVSEIFGAYHWSNGSFLDHILVDKPGSYNCEVSNIYGCESISDEVKVTFNPSIATPELHYQADGNLRVFHDSVSSPIYTWNLNILLKLAIIKRL
jgi:hypothetical protein